MTQQVRFYLFRFQKVPSRHPTQIRDDVSLHDKEVDVCQPMHDGKYCSKHVDEANLCFNEFDDQLVITLKSIVRKLEKNLRKIRTFQGTRQNKGCLLCVYSP